MNQLCGFLQRFIFYVYVVLSRVVLYSLIEQVFYGTMCTQSIFSSHLSRLAEGLQVYAFNSEILAETVFYKSLAKQVIFYLHRKGAQLPFHHPVFAS